MLQAYFVTGIDRFDTSASALVSAHYNDEYLADKEEKMKKEFAEFEWNTVKLGQLYDEVHTQNPLIALAKNAEPYEKAIKEKYPNATVILVNQID